MNNKPRGMRQILSIGILVFLLVFPILAQQDPNPDSPIPVLISEPESNRALAMFPENFSRANMFSDTKQRNFAGFENRAFCTNLDLMEGEECRCFSHQC